MDEESFVTNTQAAVEAGRRSADVKLRTSSIEGVPIGLFVSGDEERVIALKDVVELQESLQPVPSRKVGIAQLTELESFIAHVNRNKQSESTIWADSAAGRITAIYDFHGPADEDPGWAYHRAIYMMPFSPEWLLWTAMSDKEMGQEELAGLLEDHAENLAKIDGLASALEMIEMARSLQIYIKGHFAKTIHPETGQYSLVCKEEHAEGSTKIPRAFGLGLRIYEGGEIYQVEARLRFRMREGRPRFSFAIHRQVELVRDAFLAVQKRVEDETELPVFAGRSEAG